HQLDFEAFRATVELCNFHPHIPSYYGLPQVHVFEPYCLFARAEGFRREALLMRGRFLQNTRKLEDNFFETKIAAKVAGKRQVTGEQSKNGFEVFVVAAGEERAEKNPHMRR